MPCTTGQTQCIGISNMKNHKQIAMRYIQREKFINILWNSFFPKCISIDVKVVQTCIEKKCIPHEIRLPTFCERLVFFYASLYVYFIYVLGGKHRWNLLHRQWSLVRYLLPYFETYQPYLWRFEPFGFLDHVR